MFSLLLMLLSGVAQALENGNGLLSAKDVWTVYAVASPYLGVIRNLGNNATFGFVVDGRRSGIDQTPVEPIRERRPSTG